LVTVFGSDVPHQRLGTRAHVDEAAAIALEQKRRFRAPSERLVQVTIRDVSVSGALLTVPADTDLEFRQVFDLMIDNHRGAVRVRRTTPAEGHLVGVEFIDPYPAFLPTIHHWLGRSAALGTSQMR
jgi:hypothetical protein